MYDDDFPRANLVTSGLKRPWAGLYLQSRAFHRLGASATHSKHKLARVKFGSSHLMGVGVLEPGILALLRQASPTLNARLFPDILEPASDFESDEATRLRQRMLAEAKGKPILSLLGYLQPSKGVELFLRAACDPRLADVAFVLGGALHRGGFAPDALSRIDGLMERAPNLIRIPNTLDECSFNAAIRGSDVLFAAYVNFPYSSNIQVKAAQFNKPIIVTDGSLMADRCRAYRLGECIPENDLEALAAAIRRIVTVKACSSDDEESKRLRENFVSQHDEAAVHEAMKWVIELAQR
jgi:glycosyltransferase involved in cell wall biosynthesis